VLKINSDGGKLLPLARGSSADLRVGSTALAIGNPFGLDHSLTVGVISGLGREVRTRCNSLVRLWTGSTASLSQWGKALPVRCLCQSGSGAWFKGHGWVQAAGEPCFSWYDLLLPFLLLGNIITPNSHLRLNPRLPPTLAPCATSLHGGCVGISPLHSPPSLAPSLLHAGCVGHLALGSADHQRDPDGRRHQPGQLWRRATRLQRPAHRDEHRHLLTIRCVQRPGASTFIHALMSRHLLTHSCYTMEAP
jgi:hypothetical protein